MYYTQHVKMLKRLRVLLFYTLIIITLIINNEKVIFNSINMACSICSACDKLLPQIRLQLYHMRVITI